MLNVHLYFVKPFGYHIAGNGIPLDITGFAAAIKSHQAHPGVYLRSGCGRTFAGEPEVGQASISCRG
jgi:hypothetical protein